MPGPFRRLNATSDETTAMTTHGTFHPGERMAQVRAGETAIAARNGAIVTDSVFGGMRAFIAKQSMVVVGSVDATGRVWASMLFGRPGFAGTGDGSTVWIDMPATSRDRVDPLWANLAVGKHVGLLFADLGARRRYRVNGDVSRIDDGGFEIAVREAFPNCPRYIQRRQLNVLDASVEQPQAAYGKALRGSVRDIVRLADTIFVASHNADTGADVSHRGGDIGFVQVVDESTLRIPDFNGNSLFNTVGNFIVDPRAGLCIPDFDQGRLLQLTGNVSVHWDSTDPSIETGGTGRYWEFHIEAWILRDAMRRAEWEYIDASPFNPPSSV